MPALQHLERDAKTSFEAPGLGRALDQSLAPLESLRTLHDLLWAVYEHDGAWRLHVSAGFELRLNGVVTGGGALISGDVIDDGTERLRFVSSPWPGLGHQQLDARTLAAPHDDALALVYRDWLLEHESALAETLRRPVPLAEQARHLWSLAPRIATGLVEARFAGPFVQRVTVRDPQLDLVDFVEALSRCAADQPYLDVVRTIGLSTDDGVQLALLLARTPALSKLVRLEAGDRGAWQLDDFRRHDQLDPHARDVARFSSPREGPARPVTLEVVSWDGWTAVEPLTSAKALLLDRDMFLTPLDEGATLTSASASATVALLRKDDWVLEVTPSARPPLLPSRLGLPVRDQLGLALDEVFEIVDGLRCRLTPAR